MIHRLLVLFITFFLISCNLPSSNAVDIPTQPALIDMSPVAPSTEAHASTVVLETPISPTPTATSTPIPCDPLTVDYCITAGHFLFQRPILPPDNDKVDLTYLYASTQNGRRDPHRGVEYQNAFGTPVYAAGDGVVVFADVDKTTKFAPWTNFYGNVVVIQHSDEMYTLYAHLSTILLQAGDEVAAGDVIGQVGATGGATGSHLHFEVRKGSDYTDYFSTENPELWTVPPRGTGAISITLLTAEAHNYERPLVITRYAEGSNSVLFTYYITSYAKGFELNTEDAVLSNLPEGIYRIALSSFAGLKERIVSVSEGKLTEVVFDLK